jgi:hypothetical protein
MSTKNSNFWTFSIDKTHCATALQFKLARSYPIKYSILRTRRQVRCNLSKASKHHLRPAGANDYSIIGKLKSRVHAQALRCCQEESEFHVE